MRIIAGVDAKGAYIINSLGEKEYFTKTPECAEKYDYRKYSSKPENKYNDLYKFKYMDDIPSNKVAAASIKQKIKEKENKAKAEKFAKNSIEDVIINPPAVIVYWKDGTKTVVKCQKGDKFDAEKGLALAIIKYLFGNTGAYNTIFKYWLPIDED